MMQLVQQGRDEGFIDPTISDTAIFIYLQMFTDYLQMFTDYLQKGDAIEQLIPLTEELMKLFFYGIAGKGENKKA